MLPRNGVSNVHETKSHKDQYDGDQHGWLDHAYPLNFEGSQNDHTAMCSTIVELVQNAVRNSRERLRLDEMLSVQATVGSLQNSNDNLARVPATVNYALIAISAWLLRGGPDVLTQPCTIQVRVAKMVVKWVNFAYLAPWREHLIDYIVAGHSRMSTAFTARASALRDDSNDKPVLEEIAASLLRLAWNARDFHDMI